MCFQEISKILNHPHVLLISLCAYTVIMSICLFSGDIQDTQPSSYLLISPCACTVIMSSCVFSGDIQDTQPSSYLLISPCACTVIMSSCVFSGDIPRYSTIHMFTHFSMCLYSHNEQLCVFRRYPRFSTIYMFNSFLHVPVQS